MISLKKFDKVFFNSLIDKEKILLGENFFTVFENKTKVGIVGVVEPNFLQIIIKKEFRSKGLFEIIVNLIMEKMNLNCLSATIDKDNIASLKACKKAGFKVLSKAKLDLLRKKGFLKENQVRMIKNKL